MSITMSQQGRKICRHGGESVVIYVRTYICTPRSWFHIFVVVVWCGVLCTVKACAISHDPASCIHTCTYLHMCVAVCGMNVRMYVSYVHTNSLWLWCVVKHTTTTSFVHCLYGVRHQSDKTTFFSLTLDCH